MSSDSLAFVPKEDNVIIFERNHAALKERGTLELLDPELQLVFGKESKINNENVWAEGSFGGLSENLIVDEIGMHDWGTLFQKQQEGTTCGLACGSLVLKSAFLNSIPDSGWLSENDSVSQFDEEKLLTLLSWSSAENDSDENSSTNHVVPITHADLRSRGITLEELLALLEPEIRKLIDGGNCKFKPLRISQEDVHGRSESDNKSDGSRRSLSDVYEIILDQLRHFGCMLVNYHMSSVGQLGGCGHCSVIVAAGKVKHNESASSVDHDVHYVYLLDPWPITPCCWIPLELLVKAADTVDSTSGKKRGFGVIEIEEVHL